ncbi:MAG TPA: LCP family protein [Patescibacteria group bacterium]|nr:LCP family protein [Patescibacteria group bacterium]
MHEFRKRPRHAPRPQAIDGFFSGPNQQQTPIAPEQTHHSFIGNRLRPSGGGAKKQRRLDDFARPSGYHVVSPQLKHEHEPEVIRPQKHAVDGMFVSQSSPAPNAIPRPTPGIPQQSLLHMTLPGGPLEPVKKSKRKRKLKEPLTKWGKVRRWSLRSASAVAVIALLMGGFLFAKGFFSVHRVFKGGGSAAALQANVTPDLLNGEGSGRVNILLLGKGGGDHEGPDLTDTLLVLSVDPVNKTASMLSIPRDLWVTPPGFGAMKINAVYANEKYHDLSIDSKNTAKAETDGINLAEKVVSNILGIPINYYGMIDFAAFQQAVDTVGGVDINVPAADAVLDYMYNEDTHKPYTLNVQPGQNHFDGLRALMYVRSRHASARGDFDRTERQRLFITALSQKVLSAGTYTNPVKISQLLSNFGGNVSTDFSVNDMLRFMQIAKGIGTSNITSIGLADPPNNYVVTDNINGISIVRPTAGVGVYSDIQNFVRNTLKDPYIAKEAAKIEVLNGTVTPGLAATKADALKSFGYNVTAVASAPTSDYGTTQIIDLTGGKKPFTQHYLEQRYGVKATTKLPDPKVQAQGADFVVILGQDAASTN